MKKKKALAVSLVLVISLGACTTTKDLERRPELVAVAGTTPQGKEGALQQAGQTANRANSAADKAVAGKGDSGSRTAANKGEAAAPPSASPGLGTQKQGPEAKAAIADAAAQPEESGMPAQEKPAAPPVIVEKKIYIEKPVYYPEGVSQAPPNPVASVAEAMAGGVMRPKDYNGALMLYDYDSSLVYQVYTMPLRVTDIYLEPGEKVIEQPFCGDTTRWNIGGGVSKTSGVDTQHLYLKPSEEGLETTLIINTDRRIYHLIIKSFKDTFMLAVMWHYQGGMPHDFLTMDSDKNSTPERGTRPSADQGERNSAVIAVDPALMSSDYTVSYPKGNAPQWLPTLVLDDGEKTYIVLPDTVVHHELPAVFGENGELLNFRVKDNVIAIDRLLRKMQLKLRDVTVEIRKKGA
jgi:P-type conjugative transfer protein TrbG